MIADITMGYGVMVTLQILVLSFLVRVRVSQQRAFFTSKNAFFASYPSPLSGGNVYGCMGFRCGEGVKDNDAKNFSRSVMAQERLLASLFSLLYGCFRDTDCFLFTALSYLPAACGACCAEVDNGLNPQCFHFGDDVGEDGTHGVHLHESLYSERGGDEI